MSLAISLMRDIQKSSPLFWLAFFLLFLLFMQSIHAQSVFWERIDEGLYLAKIHIAKETSAVTVISLFLTQKSLVRLVDSFETSFNENASNTEFCPLPNVIGFEK